MSNVYLKIITEKNWRSQSWRLKSKSPCILMNKNINFNENKKESKMENLTHSFRETNFVLQLIKESKIKSKTVMTWVAKEKRWHFLYRLFCPKEFFCIRFILMYKVLNTLSEYTYFYISKNISLYNFTACF